MKRLYEKPQAHPAFNAWISPGVSFSTPSYDRYSPVVALRHFLPFLFIPI
jgi:hypothetical protein